MLRAERGYVEARRELRLAHKATLRLEDGALLLDAGQASQRIAAAEVREGWVEPGAGEGETTVVLCMRGGGRLAMRVDAADASRILEAAGVGPHQHVLRVPLGSEASQAGQGVVFHLLGPFLLALVSLLPASVLLVAITAGHTGAAVVGAAILVPILAAWFGLLRFTASGTAVVGADGSSIEYWGRKRFVPHADVLDVELERGWADAEHPGKVVVVTEKERIELPTTTYVADAPERARALAARIVEARREAVARIDDLTAAAKKAALVRNGRTVDAWRGDLARLSAERSDYRRVGFEAEELVAIVEDSLAAPEQRLGAALALSSRKEPALQQRVRVAAAACARAPLRVALGHAAEGELAEAELEAAVAEAEAAARAKRAQGAG
ncbi:MAG: hypothetical protein WKG00_40745 [Polyangiaceae bacterium]